MCYIVTCSIHSESTTSSVSVIQPKGNNQNSSIIFTRDTTILQTYKHNWMKSSHQVNVLQLQIPMKNNIWKLKSNQTNWNDSDKMVDRSGIIYFYWFSLFVFCCYFFFFFFFLFSVFVSVCEFYVVHIRRFVPYIS